VVDKPDKESVRSIVPIADVMASEIPESAKYEPSNEPDPDVTVSDSPIMSRYALNNDDAAVDVSAWPKKRINISRLDESALDMVSHVAVRFLSAVKTDDADDMVAAVDDMSR